MNSNRNNLIRFGSKSFIITAALLIILGSAISGTVAWMFVKAEPVTNTFTYGDVKVELTETGTEDGDDDKNTNSYSFAVGGVVSKDPLVTVKAGTESCWLFVEAVESDNFDSYLEYTIAEGWKSLNGEPGVYYRKVTESDADQSFPVLEGNQVKVRSFVTQEDLDALTENDYPTLDFKAYVIQQAEVDSAADAWELIN